MNKLLAAIGLVSVLANPSFAAINSLDTTGYASPQPASVACKSNVIYSRALKVEIEIACGTKSAVFMYSPVDKIFCDPNLSCRRNLKSLATQWFSSN